MRPDLIASHHGSMGPLELAIEIHVTHRVGAEKRARFAAMDLAAIEIDLSHLSRVDRRLDRTRLDLPALAVLILHDAPRSWLFNRMARDAQARADAAASERQRKREAARTRVRAAHEDAMKDVLHDQKEARRTPPRGTDPAIRAWAEEELARWSRTPHAAPVDDAGDDDPFEAEPAVWRAVVLAWIAPWSDDPTDILPDAARDAARMLRDRGFVKPGYRHAAPDRPGSHIPGDPVRDACRAVLEAVASRDPTISAMENIWAIQAGSRTLRLLRTLLATIATLAANRSATVTLRAKPIRVDVSWETARQLAEPKGDRHAPSPSDLRIIAAALDPAQPCAPGHGPDPGLSAAARLNLVLEMDGRDRTAALLAGSYSD